MTPVDSLHRFDGLAEEAAALTQAFVRRRVSEGPSLGATARRQQLEAAFGETITAGGLGVEEAFRRFSDVVVPATVGLDSPRFLAFIPAAPSALAVLFDAAVSACSFSAESWLEAAGAVHAENEVLRWLSGLFGLPATAGGCFVSGGSAGNLSALAVAREVTEARAGHHAVAVADTAHSSIAASLRLLGLSAVVVPTGPAGRLTGEALAKVSDPAVCAVVASGGSTNAGIVDDLSGIAEVARRRGWWLHVDGAYGAAACLVPTERPLFDGVEHADSVIVDPHKWLFAPLDCCALLYRDPDAAREVHTQRAPYLDSLHQADDWNPADLAYHLTRRARGLPIWFALAAAGTDAHRDAIARGIHLARLAAERIRAIGAPLELVLEPQLSVVLFRRDGWVAADWAAWSKRLLEERVAFVTPTKWKGEPVGRLVFLHPGTTEELVDEILASVVA